MNSKIGKHIDAKSRVRQEPASSMPVLSAVCKGMHLVMLEGSISIPTLVAV